MPGVRRRRCRPSRASARPGCALPAGPAGRQRRTPAGSPTPSTAAARVGGAGRAATRRRPTRPWSHVRRADGRQRRRCWASAAPLTNDRLDEEGNAALALGLLGAHARLVWYLPSPRRRAAPATQTLVLRPGARRRAGGRVVQLVVAVVLLALWRARRLGPVVTEPLPVVVRAAETAEGRGPALPPQRGARTAAGALRGGDPGPAAAGRSGCLAASAPEVGGRRGRRRAPARPAPRSARCCTVPHRPTTPRWSGSPTTSTPSRERYADRDRATQTAAPRTARPGEALRALRAEVAKAVVGQDAAVTGLVIALLCRGHVLLEGVPGVAKTLLVRTLAAALALDTKRVQFTPDLMPGDVTGSLVYDARTAEFSFRAGPVFTNLLLADEINRTPPKTQASLLEAMEERQVSVDGDAAAAARPVRRRARPRTRSSTRAPTRCPRPSSTGSCSS